MTVPLVSVLMPARNAARWIESAVTSVLTQTHRHLEVVVVDDGSTDCTTEVVESIRDARVRIVRARRPIGVGPASNLGLVHCQGELIARLDADDYMLVDRLAQQVAYLRTHPHIGLVGARAFIAHADGSTGKISPLYNGRLLHWMMQTSGAILHPTMMARRDALPPAGYPDNTRFANDWEMMLDVERRTGLAIMNQVLIVYRRHADAIGCAHLAAQDEAAASIFARQVLAPRGVVVRPSTAMTWVRTRRAAELEDVVEVRALAHALSPDTTTLGPHVPPWGRRERARAWREHANHLRQIIARSGRRDVRLALAPLALAAAVKAAIVTALA